MRSTPGTLRGVADWLFLDRRTGRYVVGQMPNVPLLVFLVARGIESLAGPQGTWGTAVRWTGTVAILWWAGDEVLRGVNPFRRILGTVVLAAVGWGILSGLG